MQSIFCCWKDHAGSSDLLRTKEKDTCRGGPKMAQSYVEVSASTLPYFTLLCFALLYFTSRYFPIVPFTLLSFTSFYFTPLHSKQQSKPTAIFGLLLQSLWYHNVRSIATQHYRVHPLSYNWHHVYSSYRRLTRSSQVGAWRAIANLAYCFSASRINSIRSQVFSQYTYSSSPWSVHDTFYI